MNFLNEINLKEKIKEFNKRVDDAMFRPNGDSNTLLKHFDEMPEGHQFWALLDLLERREFKLMGFKLSRSNLRQVRTTLQKYNIDVGQFS